MQLNISLLGDAQTGKKTFLKQLLQNQKKEELDLSLAYYPIKLESEKNYDYNFFLTRPEIKNLSKTIKTIITSDILLYFFNLVEEENELFFEETNESKKKEKSQKENQLNKYKTLLEPICEVLQHFNFEKRIIILLNKIDHPFVEYSKDISDKAEKFIKNIFESYFIDYSKIKFISISSLENKNILEPFLEDSNSFYNELQNITEEIIIKKERKIEKYLPLRISILQKHKIMGIGVVVQGRVLSGEIKKDDELILLPSNKKTTVKSIEIYNKKIDKGVKSQIIGINLKNIFFNEVFRGSVLTKIGFSSYENFLYNGAILKIDIINRFNGIYLGFQLNLIGYYNSFPCFVKDIYHNVDFLENKDEDLEKEKFIDSGSCFMKVAFKPKFYYEKYTDFPKLGKFVIMESNVVLGFAEIEELINIKN